MEIQKPNIIRKSLQILWVTQIIGIIRTSIEFPRLSQQGSRGGGAEYVLFITIFSFLIVSLLIYLIGKRKNWARWMYVFLFVIGLPFSIKPLIQSIQLEPFSGFLGLIQPVAQSVVCVLLFTAPSRAWFNKKPT